MDVTPERFVAIDWSGAQSSAEQRRRIVIADWHRGEISVSAGRTRAETAAWLIEQSRRTPAMVVGLDFSFSFPEWFVRECGATRIEDFWKIAASQSESWLGSCHPPFWGRPAKPCPADHRSRGYRLCEQKESIGWNPKSTFQIGGAGAIGTGSLRGMQTLLDLRRNGFSIWPFDTVALPCIFEIYPRSFTGVINKSSRNARAVYLEEHLARVAPEAAIAMARDSEDAFDALCSVVGLVHQRQECAQLRQAQDTITLLEGAIFPGRVITGASAIY